MVWLPAFSTYSLVIVETNRTRIGSGSPSHGDSRRSASMTAAEGCGGKNGAEGGG